ncbi:hypothetical protein NQ314_011253, partial [Rhamnusium bicolor]
MSLLIDDSVETLIEEIEKRPALYLKSLKEYSDVNLKKKLWEEVCVVVVSHWNELGPEEKLKKEAEPENNSDNDEMDDTTVTNYTLSTASAKKSRKRKVTEENNLDRELVNFIKKSEVDDADTHFLLSLVPMMKELSENEKLDAKLQMLQIFKQIKMARTEPSIFPQRDNYNLLRQDQRYVHQSATQNTQGPFQNSYAPQYPRSPINDEETA